MNNFPKCNFKNKYMTSPCGKTTLKNLNEWYCLDHGTISFVREAWDSVETPDETYEAENGGTSWSQDEISNLLNMSEREVSLVEIAKTLGRSKNSVYSKLWAIAKT